MSNSHLLELFLALLRIASPSKREGELARFVAGRLTELGLEVRFDGAGERIGGDTGNLIAHLPATDPARPPILLCAHMDTVQGDALVNPVVEDGAVRADGTVLGSDDKAGVAAIVSAVRRLVEERPPHGRVELVFTVAEEIGLLGAKNADLSDVQARQAYVFDSEGPVGKITVRAPYQDSWKARFRGVAAHAGVSPEDGKHAVLAAARAIAEMPMGRLDPETTANVGTIEGGKATNIIPDHAEMRGEARSLSPGKLARQSQEMHEVCRRSAESAGCTVEFDIHREYEGFNLSETDQVVARALSAMKSIGLAGQTTAGGGGSDTNIFNASGLASVNLSVGYDKAHSNDEFTNIADLERAADLAFALITG